MKKSFTIIVFLLTSICYAQEAQRNLDFEILEDGKAKNWNVFGKGDYKVTYVETEAQHGKTCALIESTGSNIEFNALAFNIPADFGGKRMKLTGYVKTENVEGGWAGLWMRIDPQIAFDNMQNRGIKGTTDWTKYEIELDINNNAKQIVVGGILVGTGKVWVDNLEVTVDGNALDNAPERELSLAQKDKTFDNGSKISVSDLKEVSSENLELLGRIWGFLKYYHPAIGKGDYNWDYELFRMLPEYVKASTNAERDRILLKWIDTYGVVSDCKNCKEVSSEAFLKPDFNWLDKGVLSTSLKEKLNFIKKNRHQGEHYYIG